MPLHRCLSQLSYNKLVTGKEGGFELVVGAQTMQVMPSTGLHLPFSLHYCSRLGRLSLHPHQQREGEDLLCAAQGSTHRGCD